MDGACSMHGRDEKRIQNVLFRKPERQTTWETKTQMENAIIMHLKYSYMGPCQLLAVLHATCFKISSRSGLCSMEFVPYEPPLQGWHFGVSLPLIKWHTSYCQGHTRPLKQAICVCRMLNFVVEGGVEKQRRKSGSRGDKFVLSPGDSGHQIFVFVAMKCGYNLVAHFPP